MNTLEAVNRMLRLASHQTVNEIADGDQHANVASNTLTRVRRDMLARPLDFNERTLDLPANAAGRVPVSVGSYLAITLPKGLTVRHDSTDGKHYVWNTSLDAWHGERVDNVAVTHDVPFEKVPENFAQWISWEATAEYYAEHRGNPTEYIMMQLRHRKAICLNSLPPCTIHEATGYTTVLAAHLAG